MLEDDVGQGWVWALLFAVGVVLVVVDVVQRRRNPRPVEQVARDRVRSLRLLAGAGAVVVLYLLAQATRALLAGDRPTIIVSLGGCVLVLPAVVVSWRRAMDPDRVRDHHEARLAVRLWRALPFLVIVVVILGGLIVLDVLAD